MVYCIPCSCSQRDQTEIGDETEGTRDACKRGMMEKSAVSEHVRENQDPIYWEETTIPDHSRGQELLVKEALHIQMTPVEERFN